MIQSTVSSAASATEKAQQTVVDMVAGFWAQTPYIVVGLVVFVLFLVGASIVKRVIKGSVIRTGYDQMIASLLGRIGYYAIAIAGFFVAAVVVFPGMSPGDLLTGLGIGSVALGFAFKDVLQNLFAGFLIMLYRPFRIGDQIKVNDFEGIVEEISVRATKLKTGDSQRVVLPNSDLYMNAVLVRTAFEIRRSAVVVGIGYEDDPEQARDVLLKTVKNLDGVLDEPAPSVAFTDLGDSSVNLKILFWTKSDQSSASGAIDKVVVATKNALDEAGIDMPFPQRVVEMKQVAA